jgi:RNA polymerase sigma-70 factor (ECF subfamily)
MTLRDKDINTLKRIRNGDFQAYECLVKKYSGPLMVYIVNIVRHRETAEDILQEVFFAAYKNLAGYNRLLGSFSTWLFCIARNRCLNELKRKHDIPEPDFPTLRTEETPESALREKETLTALDRALDSLSLEDRSVFILAEIDGLQHRDIARIEKIRTGTVKSRLSRTKEKLRTALRKVLGDDIEPGS